MKIYILEWHAHFPVDPLGEAWETEDVGWFRSEADCKDEMDKKNRNNRDTYCHYAMREEELR